ncbi:hypothetical protein Nisw_07975 [Candidatus Nitrosopumilus sp. SW]|uniref:hypothetical protein n=1 Tax=Candidatus Nitrosopumilus sp. SW TaxID=2508726 RepID=UPI001153F8DA|nr:hypothetical protein [Candidatus Nitrosopumilus sp. SW]QDI89465.1 hypothetical protein Nisw_07975 [Candidatus Nitrosopumilus sp. SW]
MTPNERKNLQKLDDLVLNASAEELKKIQEVDHQNQMEGLSLYEVYLDSSSLINQSVKKPSRKS